jgi:class 3 adenylate cyclase
MGAFSRVISFDKSGTGMSDPIPPSSLPPLAEWTNDVGAVMDVVGSERAAVVAVADGGMMALEFAASNPERTRSLVLIDSTARLARAPGYPMGVPPEREEAMVAMANEAWGRPDSMLVMNPTAEEEARANWARQVRSAASPATAVAICRMLFQLDVRDRLAEIRVPTLILHRPNNPWVGEDQGRWLAEHIPGARFVETPGHISNPRREDIDLLAGHIEEFLTGQSGTVHVDRMLTTVLFTDIVGSTERAAQLGDLQWKRLLDAHDDVAARTINRFQGRLVKSTGDGLLATFDGPARAVRCALALRDELRGLGIDIRAGLHTGEVERRGGDVGGLAVHIAARVQSLAAPGEVLASRTVGDLVVGSNLRFTDRGAHQLRGVPGDWQVLGVEG